MASEVQLPDAPDEGVPPTVVYNFWKDFDLNSLRGKLDEQGLSIASAQETSVASRKGLAEKTKAFRASLPPDVFKQLAPLLKIYQQEVDALTNRARAGESAFLDIFKALYEAPDPAPSLASSLELASRAADLETQAAKTATELAEYKAESKELKNQDVTIRRLEEKIRSLEAEVAEKDAAIESAHTEAAAVLEARSADEAREREARLEAELHRAEAALEAVKRMHQTTQSQLFSVQERGEEAAAAARTEAEYAAAEVERAQEQLALLARERDSLLERMQEDTDEGIGGDGGVEYEEESGGGGDGGAVVRRGSSSGAGGTSSRAAAAAAAAAASQAQVSALREELRAQRELASRLQDELSSAVRRAEGEASAAVARLEGAQAQLQASESRIAALEAELAGRPTRQELEDARQKVRVLSAVFHNVAGGEEEEEEGDAANDSNSTGTSGNKDASKDNNSSVVSSLESALLAKNRHLEHTLTMARLEAADARSAAETATARLSDLEGELERQKQLVEKLEEDLMAAERIAGLGEAFVAENSIDASDGVTGSAGDGADGKQQLPVSRSASGAAATSAMIGGVSVVAGGEATMLSVLSAQRDRLRGRVAELEGELATAHQQLTKTKHELETARSDNLALVERLRYVQGYAAASGARRSSGGSLLQQNQQHQPLQDVEAGGGDGGNAAVVGRYLREYEDKVVNPLNDFRKREREARQRALPLQDRAAVAVGSALVTGSKAARSAIMVYAIALHLMAFIVLAGFSHRHVDRLDELEALCAGLHPLDAAAVAGGGGGGTAAVVDPVVGGGTAAVHALLRRLLF